MKKIPFIILIILVATLLAGCDFLGGSGGNSPAERVTHTVTFVDGDDVYTKSVEDGKKVSSILTSKEGYTFLGWYYGDVKWNFDDIVTSDMTLVANWEIKSYAFIIDYNDGVTPEYREIIECGDNIENIVTIKTPSKDGYTFIGWDKEIPTAMPASSYTITARWQINRYSITLKYNDGITKDEKKEYDYGSNVYVREPSREGYTFVGWDKEVPTTMPANDLELEAIWEVKKHNITIKYNNGAEDEIKTLNCGESIEIENPTRDGYTFNGWNKEIPAVMPDNDITIEATWTINKYNFTIKYEDGVTADKVISYDYQKPIEYIFNPERDGYTFKGWDKEIPRVMPASDVTIKAIWTINKYNLTIKYNDGVTEDKEEIIDFGATFEVEAPKKEGYTFKGWDKEVPSSMPANDLVLEATWEINKYTITIKYNDDVREDYVTTLDYNSSVSLSNPVRNGYTFAGWDKEVPAIMPANDLVFEASWNVNKYNLTIKYNDGVTSNTVLSYDFKSVIEEVQAPLRAGYTFDGWNIDIPETMPSYDVTITATWQCDVNYTISSGKITITGLKNETVEDLVILERYNGNEVTEIASSAFYSCTSLKTVTLPNTIKTIGESAFARCTSLTEINIPSSVTSIENYAFEACGFKTITLPNSITIIKDGTFRGSEELTEIIIPESVKTIERNAFWGCISLSKVVIPSSVEAMNKDNNFGVFRDCTSLKSAGPIGSGADIEFGWETSIPDGAFYDLDSLNVATIPEGITKIGNNAFANCTGLNYISLPNTLRIIDLSAFINCKSLMSITIPASVTKIESSAFFQCLKLVEVVNLSLLQFTIGSTDHGCVAYYAKEILTSEENSHIIRDEKGFVCYNDGENKTLIAYIGNEENIIVPEDVTKIGDSAFYRCRSACSILLPVGIKEIGKEAFCYCTSLSSINLPYSIISMGINAFSNCSSLKTAGPVGSGANIEYGWAGAIITNAFYGSMLESVIIDSTLIGDCLENAFAYCNNLKSVYTTNLKKWCEIEYGNKYSNPLAYAHNLYVNGELLTDLVISSGITKIQDFAFYGCASLQTIEFTSEVTVIGKSAFYNCTSLESVKMPASIETIGDDAFHGTSLLKTAGDLESSANIKYEFGESLDNRIFTNFDNIETITIPEGVTSIGYGEFMECTKLESVIVPSTVETIGGSAFNYCTSLKNVNIPYGITTLESSVFYACTSLDSIVIPTTVTKIKSDAFNYCSSLKTITIPDEVEEIGEGAFGACASLESITLPFVGNKRHEKADAYQYPFGYIFGNVSYTDGVLTSQRFYGAKDGDGHLELITQDYYIPRKLKEVTITTGTYIQTGAFYNCTTITNVNIPSDLESFEEYAFYNCTSLVTLNGANIFIIPSSVKVIDAGAFYNCSSIEKLRLINTSSAELEKIGSNAFMYCTSLTNVYFQSSDKDITIWNDAFFECNKIRSITIPKNVVEIRNGVFGACTSLESITLPFVGNKRHETTDKYQYPFGYIFGGSIEGVQTSQYYIGDSLQNLTNSIYVIPSSLTEVTITDGASIPCGAFYNCKNLKKINLPGTLATIEREAFAYCIGLEELTITEGVTTIREYAFRDCTGIKNLILPNSVMYIEKYAFYNCSGIETIYWSASLETIGEGAFCNCTSLGGSTYNGTVVSWRRIEKGTDWYKNTPNFYCFCAADGTYLWK